MVMMMMMKMMMMIEVSRFVVSSPSIQCMHIVKVIIIVKMFIV